MSSKGIEMGSVIVLMALLWARTVAQSGCTNVLIGMAPCLNYVTGSNSSNTPSSSCCSSLASVVKSQPQCLCTALNGGISAALGININQTLALGLPAACKVQTPPVSRCYASNGPARSPVSSPENSPIGAPAGAPISPSVFGPANGATASDATTLKAPFLAVIIITFMAL